MLNHESKSQFDDLVCELRRDLMPKGMLQELLVEKIATNLWRYRRLLQAESATVQKNIEAQAEHKTAPDEQTALLRLALDNYLRVFNEGHLLKDQKPDLFWTKKAGLDAGRLAEKLQWWPQAISVYQRLKELLPSLSASFENRIRKAQEHLGTAKAY